MAGTSLPADAAQLCLWRTGLSAPTVFVVETKEANKVQQDFADGVELLEFQSYPDGSGRRSRSVVKAEALDAVTSEYATIRLTGVMPNG